MFVPLYKKEDKDSLENLRAISFKNTIKQLFAIISEGCILDIGTITREKGINVFIITEAFEKQIFNSFNG